MDGEVAGSSPVAAPMMEQSWQYTVRSRHNHPGQFIRDEVLPKGLAVTKAAEILGISRPALSNLLNGNAALTLEMAIRLEKSFGADSQDLLTRQRGTMSSWGALKLRKLRCAPTCRLFWASRRGRSPVGQTKSRHARSCPRYSAGSFIRLVVASAGSISPRTIMRSALAGMATCPPTRRHHGFRSGCPVGNSAAIRIQPGRPRTIIAHGLHQCRLKSVCPRHSYSSHQEAGPARTLGLERKRREREWKEVRAYDASDLEQWLEQSVAAQAWFAERIGNGGPGTGSLDDCWKQWADVTDPPLSKTLFRSAIATNKTRLSNWLSRPPLQPFVVTADSEIEALAFISCALEEVGDNPGQFFDRALVLRTADALKRAAASEIDLVAVVCSPDAEQISAGLQKDHHMLVVRRHNDVSTDPDITLALVDHQTFSDGLTTMGIPWEEHDRYVRETAHSATILRRRLSHIPAICTPAWSTDKALARKLIPLNLAGVWNSEFAADREIIRLLAKGEYGEIETAITDLLAVADAPVWSIGNFRGITSKIDVLFATRLLVTKEDLENFFLVAEYVLSESDPALELPPTSSGPQISTTRAAITRRYCAAAYAKLSFYSPFMVTRCSASDSASMSRSA